MDALLDLTTNSSLEQVQSAVWWQQLVDAVSNMLEHDFNGLIQILYRLDVSEEKIRTALELNQQTPAAILLANIILERQVKKLHDRKHFSAPKPDCEDELSW